MQLKAGHKAKVKSLQYDFQFDQHLRQSAPLRTVKICNVKGVWVRAYRYLYSFIIFYYFTRKPLNPRSVASNRNILFFVKDFENLKVTQLLIS